MPLIQRSVLRYELPCQSLEHCIWILQLTRFFATGLINALFITEPLMRHSGMLLMPDGDMRRLSALVFALILPCEVGIYRRQGLPPIAVLEKPMGTKIVRCRKLNC